MNPDVHAAMFMVQFASDLLDDIQKLRIANSNRLLALTTDTEDFGKGYDPKILEMLTSGNGIDLLQGVMDSEKRATKLLMQGMKKHPLYDWIKDTPGLGEKSVGRFLATIGGDPYWHPIYERSRTIGELYAYCGLHVVEGQAAKKKKGQLVNWSTEAKTRAYVMAEPCIKNKQSAYRHVYDEGRLKYAECEITPGQQHARAIRLVMKTIIKDMWKESGRLFHANLTTAQEISESPI